MPNIVQITDFQQANSLNIPLSNDVPVSNAATQSPNSKKYLEDLIIEVEKTVLLNAFGLSMYNELQLALADIDNPLYASYKKLVQGEEYDSKYWDGLKPLLDYKVYEEFLISSNNRLSSLGVAQTNVQNATLVTPAYKIANASQKFAKKYQGGYLETPIITDNFIDWFGQNDDVEVSLYRYMIDKKTDFPLFDIYKFRTYETQNSFGI